MSVYEMHYHHFAFKLTSDAKIQPAITGREGSCFWPSPPWSRVGHDLRPMFMLWLVKIWQVSSCGKFTQHLETCLPMAEADRVWCRHLVMFLTVFFHWMYKMKYNCHQDSSLIHGWFVCWVFGWEMRRLSKSSEIRFRMDRFYSLPLAWCVL